MIIRDKFQVQFIVIKANLINPNEFRFRAFFKDVISRIFKNPKKAYLKKALKRM